MNQKNYDPRLMIVQNCFEIIFDFYPPYVAMLLGLTNRLVPKFSKNSNKNLVKINPKVDAFSKMQF